MLRETRQRRWSQARIQTTSFSSWTNAVTSSEKWDRRYTTSGTKTFSSKPFQASTTGLRTASYERREFRPDDIRQMVHNLYVDNLSCSFNLSQLQAAASPCRWCGTTAVA